MTGLAKAAGSTAKAAGGTAQSAAKAVAKRADAARKRMAWRPTGEATGAALEAREQRVEDPLEERAAVTSRP